MDEFLIRVDVLNRERDGIEGVKLSLRTEYDKRERELEHRKRRKTAAVRMETN